MTTEQPEALRLADHLERFRSFPDDLAAAAELRRLHEENQALKRQLNPQKTIMNPAQFDAMVRIKAMNPKSKTCKAARSVFVDGLSMYAASKLHEISEASVQASCKSIRAALRDCYIIITGEESTE